MWNIVFVLYYYYYFLVFFYCSRQKLSIIVYLLREDQQEVYYHQAPGSANIQVLSNSNGTIDLNQPVYLNQVPVVQNQQVVYQLPQGLTTGDGSGENTYYVFIPVNENETQTITLPKDETELKAGQYVTYRTVNEVKPTSVITIDGTKEKIVYENTNNIKMPTITSTGKVQQLYVVDNKEQTQVTEVQQQQSPTSSVSSKWKNQLYRCDHSGCHEKFSSLHEKKLHLEAHLFPESDSFKCNICDLTFKKAIDRNKHVETHSITSTHKCKHCQKCFPYMTSLLAHVESLFPYSPFSCFFCGRKFDDTPTFLRHNNWSMKMCKCGAKICGDMMYQKHVNSCKDAHASEKTK